MTSSDQIISALRRGDTAAALSALDRQLAGRPDDSELYGLKALAMALANRPGEAEEAAQQAFARAATPAQRLKHAANLARLLARYEKREQLSALAGRGLPDLHDIAEGDLDAGALQGFCAALLQAGHHDLVSRYLAPVLDRPALGFEIEQLWLAAATGAGRHDEILARFNGPAYRWRAMPVAIGHAAAAADALDHHDEAARLQGSYLAAAPIHVAPRRPSQVMTIVHIARTPGPRGLARPLHLQHLDGNYPSQLSAVCADRYRFVSVFAGSPSGAGADQLQPGEPAITLNNCVNAENLKGGDLAQVQAHERALGLPVVNAAEKAIHCTRGETAERVRGIPNLIVPKAMRFRLDAQLLEPLCRRIRDLFAFPVILRSVGEQEGANVHLARNDRELPGLFSQFLAIGCRDFYAIDYAGVEHENGFHRRIRAAFVEGVPTIIRGDYDDQWMVRGRKFDRILDHYRRDPALFAMANAVVEQPERLGEAAWTALHEVGRRIPLDIFGMDFDVDREGRVVFFESNATMLLLSNAPKDLDYPQDAQHALLARMDKLFTKKAGLTPQ